MRLENFSSLMIWCLQGDDKQGIHDLEVFLQQKFSNDRFVKHLKYLPRTEIARSSQGISLSKTKYVLNLL